MKEIKLSILIEDFLKALSLKCPYVSPGNTTMSTIQNGVDCSGLFVAAFKHQGASIYHGSNTIWRDGSLSDKGVLKSTSQLFPGCVVFKWSASGLPSKYSDDGEGNFQHIGLCVSTNPLRIIHASTEGMQVKCDTKLGKWKYWGKFKNVDYDELQTTTEQTDSNDEEMTDMSTINGKLTTKCVLNVRKSNSTSSTKLGTLAKNTTVEYTGDPDSGWVKITYNGSTAYINADSKYVTILTKNTSSLTTLHTGDTLTQISELWDLIESLRVRLSELEAKF